MDGYDQRALFLFQVSELVQNDDLIRRLIGTGHQVGLLLTGSDSDDWLSQIEQGRQLLSDIARAPLFFVSVDTLSGNSKQVLSNMGCAVWEATLQADGLTQSALLSQLSASDPNYLELACDESGLALLRKLLPTLRGEEYLLCQVFSSTLS